ncbi:hypothetical protein HY637_00265 [Candidatus Woesearchaeota archaeon]|nr:hypothetical protein [Candidatus Woesearchaeota archaeon]
MDSKLTKKILKEWTGNSPINKKIVLLFEKVRDIPYGDIGSRNPEEVFKNNKGTCSGKHELLKGLYQELGLSIKDFIVMHKFNDLKVDFPDEIKQILKRTEILDPHNFLKIFINDKWITVDVTWDKSLKKLGFIVNEEWDGKSDMKLCVIPVEIIETDNPIKSKKQMIAKLPDQVQQDRKLFLQKMTEWLNRVR